MIEPRGHALLDRAIQEAEIDDRSRPLVDRTFHRDLDAVVVAVAVRVRALAVHAPVLVVGKRGTHQTMRRADLHRTRQVRDRSLAQTRDATPSNASSSRTRAQMRRASRTSVTRDTSGSMMRSGPTAAAR